MSSVWGSARSSKTASNMALTMSGSCFFDSFFLKMDGFLSVFRAWAASLPGLESMPMCCSFLWWPKIERVGFFVFSSCCFFASAFPLPGLLNRPMCCDGMAAARVGAGAAVDGSPFRDDSEARARASKLAAVRARMRAPPARSLQRLGANLGSPGLSQRTSSQCGCPDGVRDAAIPPAGVAARLGF